MKVGMRKGARSGSVRWGLVDVAAIVLSWQVGLVSLVDAGQVVSWREAVYFIGSWPPCSRAVIAGVNGAEDD